jgi:hypothetical protein
MRNALIVAAGAAFIASSAAMADVSGIFGQDTLRYYAADGETEAELGDAAYAVIDLYVDFSATNTHGFNNADSHMLSTFNMNFQSNNFGFFNQNDITGQGNGEFVGSWKPSFSFDIPMTSNSKIDSFITIGGGVGSQAATNVTTPDPNLGAALNGAIFNDNVGWFLNPPTSTQGDVLDFEVWVGRFVVTGDDARNGANFDVSGTIGYNYGSGTGSFNTDVGGNFLFEIPAPGALALLGLGGLCSRRRRA